MALLTGICSISCNRKKAESQSFSKPKNAMVLRFKAASQWRCRDVDSSGFQRPLDKRFLRQWTTVSVAA
ncbi:hypothetical protein DSCO28_17430 [Desulfosarcina ovata subsp. sediminis]|uniref:Uncharacterized protein n=1 Tax=Desulfosarcina ovata subsp. sediminis TaxID=885957 RepID=A0A5K7ZM58_9BACT|nr:hypothetical protein DSCO28_13590 [Desulfosarcina ovata subsp. sediminis]BBO81177.1 hypothetical protein DSCO28_17430 [Desulfosarcina ovata subsp. sediminis]